MSRPPILRCAIYTRKSSEEGLDQSFNSLDAQREACEAYVLSQAGEGWNSLATLYDDGGFSGGSMERPGLKRLLADIAAKKVDVVVVYKVDRLTRSLTDFARIVDVFDQAGASFVSVTQAFNTTTSMGRLTLNVLLSFAQFEREVTGERIRDKIRMSKAKGMWMGGMIPLGYDVIDRKLVVNLAEAALVRRIFNRYLELGSVHQLRDELEAEGVRSKSWTARNGQLMGGAIFNRGGLYHLLQSRIYVGEIPHKQLHYPGLHAPIIDLALFDAVRARLSANVSGHIKKPGRSARSVLLGRIFDADGNPMSPSFSYGRHGRAYRYYISVALQVGRKRTGDSAIRRINADEVERFATVTLSRLAERPLVVEDLASIVQRLELRFDETHIIIAGSALAPRRHKATLLPAVRRTLAPEEVALWEDESESTVRIVLPIPLTLRGGRVWLDGTEATSKRNQPDRGIVDALRSSHQELLELHASPLTPNSDLECARSPLNQHRRQVARLPFLAPDLQRDLLRGSHPQALKLRTMLKSNLPLLWSDQRAWFAQSRADRSA